MLSGGCLLTRLFYLLSLAIDIDFSVLCFRWVLWISCGVACWSCGFVGGLLVWCFVYLVLAFRFLCLIRFCG